MTAHTLEGVKGWPSQHAVDHRAKLSANVTIDPVFAGRCVYLNAVGEYEMGCPAGAVSKVNVPLWLFQNSDDPDVSNDGGITGSVNDDPGGWMAVAPVGWIMGLCGAGAFALATTEFDSSVTYAPGDALQAINDNADAVTGGRLEQGNRYTHMIVGSVNKPFATTDRNSHGYAELSFWPLVIPPTPA
jgi:hypothetical protein